MKSRKPKSPLYNSQAVHTPVPGKTAADYDIYAAFYLNAGGMFDGKLKIVRKTDGRLLYPFPGSAQIGPYLTKEEATQAALALADIIVKGDVAKPDLG